MEPEKEKDKEEEEKNKDEEEKGEIVYRKIFDPFYLQKNNLKQDALESLKDVADSASAIRASLQEFKAGCAKLEEALLQIATLPEKLTKMSEM